MCVGWGWGGVRGGILEECYPSKQGGLGAITPHSLPSCPRRRRRAPASTLTTPAADRPSH